MFRKVQQPRTTFGGKVGSGAQSFGSKATVRRGGGGAMHHQALMAAGGQTKSPLERS